MFKVRKLALAVVGSALAFPALAQTTLTFSTWVPPTHHLSVWQRNWAADVEKATAGRLKFQELPKAPAAAPGTFDAVARRPGRPVLRHRQLHAGAPHPAAAWRNCRAPAPRPRSTRSPTAASTGSISTQVGEYNGVKMLGVWTHGPGQMFTKKPIKTLAEFKGMKIRTGGGIAEAVANALGASAFVKPAPESYELLNSGVADGVFFPFESIVSFKLDKVIGQATVFPGGLYSSSFGFFMNQEKWNKLSKQDQDVIEKFSGEYAARSNGKSWDNADKLGLDALKAAGGQHRRRDARR